MAPVNKIIPFSSVDGPGNRTSVFLQGCNMDCKYCHNPETRKECRNCGECVLKCPVGALDLKGGHVVFDYTKCVACDTCIKTCRFDASPRIRELSPEETMAEIMKQVPYIRGVTISGGECSLHADFIRDLFILCKDKGLGTLIDSNGSYDYSKDPELLAVTDGVMLDVKAWCKSDHQKVTDYDNSMVLKNLEFLASVGKLYEVRTVIVPELFDIEETVVNTAKIIVKYLDVSDIRYKLITYRPMGVRHEYSGMTPPSQEQMRDLADKVKKIGVKTVVNV